MPVWELDELELGDNPPRRPLDPRRSETTLEAELLEVALDVTDAEVLVTVGVIEVVSELVG